MPGRQRLRGGERRGHHGAHLPRDAAQLDLGRRRQHHGARPAARAAQGRRRSRRWRTNSRRPRARMPRSIAWLARCRRGSRQMATEVEARRLAQDVALAVQAALLLQTAPAAVFARLLRVAPRRRLGPCLRDAGRRHRLRCHHRTRDAALNRQQATRKDHAMPDLILHHYPSSPFSEKIRLDPGLQEAGLEVGDHPGRSCPSPTCWR